jgi:uncharacterized protein (DUF697 family)
MLLEAWLATSSRKRRRSRNMAKENAKVQAAGGSPAGDAATLPLAPAGRLHRAETITKDHVLMATAVGFVPGPGLDLAGGFAVQLALLARLSKLYEVPYSENAGKGVIYSLVGSVGGIGVGSALALSAIKVIPLLGTAVGVLSMPVMMGAFTYAVGKVFTQHFESGGTFLDFDPASYRQYFREMFRRGRSVARDVKAETTATSGGSDPLPASSASA